MLSSSSGRGSLPSVSLDRSRVVLVLVSVGVVTCLVGSLLNRASSLQTRMVAAPPLACPDQYEPWPPTRCFVDRFADAHSRVTVVGVNWGYIDMFDDWRRMASRVGVANYIVMAYDRRTFDALNTSERVLLPLATESEMAAVEYATDDFRRLTRTRPGVLKALVELGYSVFYADVDTMFRSNPYDVFESVIANDTAVDVIVSEDGAPGYWCSCLLYFTPTSTSSGLIHRWMQFAESDPTEDDQVALNRAKTNITDQYRAHTVPGSVFPSGKDMWIVGYDWARHPQGPVVVHANYLHGHDEKKRVLHSPELWNRSRSATP